jgi:hypothetical protein
MLRKGKVPNLDEMSKEPPDSDEEDKDNQSEQKKS